jgi:hypothetical protein
MTCDDRHGKPVALFRSSEPSTLSFFVSSIGVLSLYEPEKEGI